MPSLQPRKFFISLEVVKEIASGQYVLNCLGYSFRVALCPPCTLENWKLFWESASTSGARTDTLPTGGAAPIGNRVGAKLQGDTMPALHPRKKIMDP